MYLHPFQTVLFLHRVLFYLKSIILILSIDITLRLDQLDPALQPKVAFSLPPSWRDRPEDSVSDSGDVTSASGGGVVSEDLPVAVEMGEVLACVVEQLEGVVKRQTCMQ